LNNFQLPGTRKLKKFISDKCGCNYRPPSSKQEEPYGFIKRVSTSENGSKLEYQMSSVLTNAKRNPKELRGQTPSPATKNPILDALNNAVDKIKKEIKNAAEQFATKFYNDKKEKREKDDKKGDKKRDDKKKRGGKKGH
jgi:hypothetical protein